MINGFSDCCNLDIETNLAKIDKLEIIQRTVRIIIIGIVVIYILVRKYVLFIIITRPRPGP